LDIGYPMATWYPAVFGGEVVLQTESGTGDFGQVFLGESGRELGAGRHLEAVDLEV
jgi:hypothetical protein